MTAIWKYPIERDGVARTTITSVPLADRAKPPAAAVRHVGLDPHGAPSIWLEVDTDAGAPAQRVVVTVVGTGFEIPADAGTHVGSFIEGPYAWHAFVGR